MSFFEKKLDFTVQFNRNFAKKRSQGQISDLSCCTTKLTKWPVCPGKTQMSLGILPVWLESSLSAWRSIESLSTHRVYSEDWSDRAYAQADLSLRWAHRSFCWFCCATAHFMYFCRIDNKVCYQEKVFLFTSSPARTAIEDGGLFCIYYDNCEYSWNTSISTHFLV